MALASLAASLCLGSPASASELSPGQAQEWKGRYCTSPGCARPAAAPIAEAAGFGAAALGALWLARSSGRRGSRSR